MPEPEADVQPPKRTASKPKGLRQRKPGGGPRYSRFLLSPSGPEDLDLVGPEQSVVRDEDQVLDLRLGDQHAVEGV